MSEDGQLSFDSEGQGPAESMPVDQPSARPELPGRRLREEREARGISLGEVAHALKFSLRQVEALEADDYSALQGATFQRGFIRSYARYLKLDAAPLLAMLDMAAPPVETEIVAPSNMGAAESEPFIERNQKWVLIALALVAVAAVGAYLLTKDLPLSSAKPEAEPAAAQPAATEAQPTVVAPTPVPLGAPAASPEAPAAPVATPTPAAPAATPATPAPSAPAAVPTPAPAVPAAPATRAPSAAVPVAPGVTAAPAAPAAPVATPSPAPKLVIDFDGRSWVEVKDATQKIVLTGEYGAGTHQVVVGKPPFQLWIGKASAVRVNYNEQKVNLQPHARDEVARLTLE